MARFDLGRVFVGMGSDDVTAPGSVDGVDAPS